MSMDKNIDKVFTGTQESYQIPLPLLSLSFFFNIRIQELQCLKRKTEKSLRMILKPSTVTYL